MIDFVTIFQQYSRIVHFNTIAITSLLLGFSVSLQAEEARVLAGITVIASSNADNTFTQRGEVKWQKNDDPTIKKERDGTYTAGDTTNSYSLKSLLVSLGSPAVNIDLSYARNSVSMTADGRAILKTLQESLEHLEEGTTIRLALINKPHQIGKDVTKRRAEILRNTLSNNPNIKLKLAPNKRFSGKAPKSASDLWRIQIQREV